MSLLERLDVPAAKSRFSIERDREAAAGGVERDAAAGHAAADDEHVEELGAQALELAAPRVPGRPAGQP